MKNLNSNQYNQILGRIYFCICLLVTCSSISASAMQAPNNLRLILPAAVNINAKRALNPPIPKRSLDRGLKRIVSLKEPPLALKKITNNPVGTIREDSHEYLDHVSSDNLQALQVSAEEQSEIEKFHLLGSQSEPEEQIIVKKPNLSELQLELEEQSESEQRELAQNLILAVRYGWLGTVKSILETHGKTACMRAKLAIGEAFIEAVALNQFAVVNYMLKNFGKTAEMRAELKTKEALIIAKSNNYTDIVKAIDFDNSSVDNFMELNGLIWPDQ